MSKNELTHEEIVRFNSDILTKKPSDYMQSALTKLRIENIVEVYPEKINFLKALADKTQRETLSHSASRTIMGAIFYLNQYREFQLKRTRKEIAQAFGTSEVSLRLAIKKLGAKQ